MFWILKNLISTDPQGCLSLNLEPKSTEYRVLINEAGQILLDPITNIPDREQWLWQNPQALAAVKCGLAQAAKGEVHDLGDFSEYADLEIEDE
ncbi:MAG: hypothetical protein QQW96_14060 [Tychonema bourrellyi B0820]|uniref:Uncharacterized protein n=1 Tax=Tychonema bourrellyi FEM_GT703 TaxID=2040638 RepID=A0A2G4F6E9_9CYAN|nr:hypothetical protein [Tychonema bourrellyi]MDQ2098761.1 hypothetical protein [Tychonema bourrellyi B0820]PHX57328.1 hypothetical protein CP500_000680 [Tychonema bourrellyi FEM_GT703]